LSTVAFWTTPLASISTFTTTVTGPFTLSASACAG